MSTFNKILILVTLISFGFTSVSEQSNQPIKLKCEYLVNPIGIDAAAPRLSWQMAGGQSDAYQSSYQILVSSDSVLLRHGSANMWNGGEVDSDEMLVSYMGKPLKPYSKYYWQVMLFDQLGVRHESAIASFETGLMNNAFKGAWISDNHDIHFKPAPYFRKQFSTEKKVISARAYIAAAGLYELSINGKRVGDHILDPMYTRFDRRLLYVTYDVTTALKSGNNAIGVILGNGWYNHQSTAVWDFHHAPWRNRPAFCMDLRITYEDGSVETIISDETWKNAAGPILFNSIYTAEHYDARLEQVGWNTSEFDDADWVNAQLRKAPAEKIVAQSMAPIRHVETLLPKSVKKINDTIYVVDFGRNMSGVTEFIVSTDQSVTFWLKHGERLDRNGRVDISNIDVHYRPQDQSDPFQTDIYTTAGVGHSVFCPRFNYKGFQFVEVKSSLPVELKAENFKAHFMHSDVPMAGRVVTSNEMFNQLIDATNNSYLSNLFGYPTDCPQREKNGWTGDAQIAIETGLYNYDGITIYEKWMADHQDEQQPNGVLPSIVPTDGWGYEWGNGPDWTSTIAIIPWNIYLFYGDSHLLKSCYPNIKKYVDHINEVYPSGLTTWGLGDWIPVKSKSPVELTSSVYYYVDAKILADAAKLFGYKEDYLKYSQLSEFIRSAINAKYLDESQAIYGSGIQTEMSVPLYWGVAPEALKARIAENLAKRIVADGNQLDVGLLGTKAILGALSENGQLETAYTLASRDQFPSWGWWITNGATTLYENWDIDAANDISLNHIMFGQIGAWFYKTLAGINPDSENPGFKNILLTPQFPEALQSVSAYHDSRYGRITSEWQRKKDKLLMKVVIPPNTTADLRVSPEYQLRKLNGKSVDPVSDWSLNSGSFEMIFEKVKNR